MKNNTLGQRLSRLRKLNGYTQQEVADMLDLSNKTISSWECDISQPDAGTVPILADIYGVTCDELLRDGEVVPKQSPAAQGDDSSEDEFREVTPAEKEQTNASQKPYTAAMQGSKMRKMFSLSALAVFWLVLGYLLAFFLQSWYAYGPVVYLSAAFLFGIALLIIVVGYFVTDNSLKEYGETAYPLRRRILNCAKVPLYLTFASYVAFMPLVGSNFTAKGNMLTYLLLAIALAVLCIFPFNLIYGLISRRHRAFFDEKQIAEDKKHTKFSRIATIVAACVTVIAVSVFYSVNFLPQPAAEYSASFRSIAEAREKMSEDPLEKYAESVDILYDEFAENSVKDYITVRYVTRPVWGVGLLLENYYPEFELIKLDDKYHIDIQLPTVLIDKFNDSIIPDDTLTGRIIVRNPLYFSTDYLKFENGKYVIEANVAYDQMLSRNKEIADACVAAVIAATDITIILVIVGMKIRERKKKKAVSLP